MFFCIYTTFLIVLIECSVSEDVKSLYRNYLNNVNSPPKSILELMDNSKGEPVAPGYHPYLTLFVKNSSYKSNFLEHDLKDFTSNDFLCSGVILNRRWILTKAKPIAFYPLGTYYMVAKRKIDIPLNPETLPTYQIDTVVIHPKYVTGSNSTDLALARTSVYLEFTFEIGSVNLPPPTPRGLSQCKLILWSFFNRANFFILTRSSLTFSVNSSSPNCLNSDKPEVTNNLLCLNQKKGSNFEPCAVHSGSPVLCEFALVGIYNGNTACTKNPKSGYSILRLNNDTEIWLRQVLTVEPYDPKNKQFERNLTRFQQCNGCNLIKFQFLLILLILLTGK